MYPQEPWEHFCYVFSYHENQILPKTKTSIFHTTFNQQCNHQYYMKTILNMIIIPSMEKSTERPHKWPKRPTATIMHCVVLYQNNHPIKLNLEILQPFLTSIAYIYTQNLCKYNKQLTHQYIYSQTSIWQHLKPGPIMVFLIHQKSADPL